MCPSSRPSRQPYSTRVSPRPVSSAVVFLVVSNLTTNWDCQRLIPFPAGGYDAIWVLVLDPPDEKGPQERIEQVWASWEGLDVSPLSATESFDQGLRLERAEDVPGLVDVLTA